MCVVMSVSNRGDGVYGVVGCLGIIDPYCRNALDGRDTYLFILAALDCIHLHSLHSVGSI